MYLEKGQNVFLYDNIDFLSHFSYVLLDDFMLEWFPIYSNKTRS